MTHPDHHAPGEHWQQLLRQEVVLDLASPYVVLGCLEQADAAFLRLSNADVHDLRDSKTTRELYVLEARRHGIRSNRVEVWVRVAEIVSLSRLTDVIQ